LESEIFNDPGSGESNFRFSEKSPILLYAAFCPYSAYFLSVNQVLITPEGQKLGGSSVDVNRN